MKITIFATLFLSIAVTGCQQQVTEFDIDEVTIALEKSENILGTYIEKLDSEFTTKDQRVKILCRDYPHEYQTNYMPNLLKLSPGEYTEPMLMADLDITLDHYKKIDSIQC